MPDISVIIPTHRRQRELAETIASVLAQDGVSLEIFVIDDCAEGSAEAVVATFAGAGVAYVRNPHPSGGRPALVRNLGWPMATGDLVHFLDDDDLVPPGYYAAAMAALADDACAGVVFGDIEPFGAADIADERRYFAAASKRARRYRKFFRPKFGLAAAILFGPTFVVCSSAMIRRSCIAPLGGFNADLPLVEDVDFYARAIRRYGAVVLDRTSIRYRIGPSLMHQPGRADVLNWSYKMIHACYRANFGILDFLALKGFARLFGGVL